MPSWYYDKKELRNSPSAIDGIEYDRECRYRREGARFIMDTGTKMDLWYNTMATGVVYFHRFYMFHSFKSFPRYVTACCCLFLAGKVEETPKKCKDIIKAAKGLLTDHKFQQFGEDPKVNMPEEVMTLERILLQTIKFDLQVEHPYSYLIKYAKCLKGDKAKLQKMVQMAWTFVNDSLCTTLCLQWEPEVIAVALMYLASKLSKFEVIDWNGRLPKHSSWWEVFVEDITTDLLEDICHQVLDLYSQPKVSLVTDSLSSDGETETPPLSVKKEPKSSSTSPPEPAPAAPVIQEKVEIKPAPSTTETAEQKTDPAYQYPYPSVGYTHPPVYPAIPPTSSSYSYQYPPVSTQPPPSQYYQVPSQPPPGYPPVYPPPPQAMSATQPPPRPFYQQPPLGPN